MMNKLMSFAVLSAIVSLPVSASASAYFVFPGTMCTPVSGSAAYTADGAVYNASTSSWLDVSCPIVRPTFNSDAYGAWLEYLDDSTWDMTCVWRTEAPLSTTVVSVSQTTSVDDTYYRELYYDNPPDINQGAAHFLCSLPPRTYGYTYVIQYKVGWSF
jgi:hypothetical protein